MSTLSRYLPSLLHLFIRILQITVCLTLLGPLISLYTISTPDSAPFPHPALNAAVVALVWQIILALSHTVVYLLYFRGQKRGLTTKYNKSLAKNQSFKWLPDIISLALWAGSAISLSVPLAQNFCFTSHKKLGICGSALMGFWECVVLLTLSWASIIWMCFKLGLPGLPTVQKKDEESANTSPIEHTMASTKSNITKVGVFADKKAVGPRDYKSDRPRISSTGDRIKEQHYVPASADGDIGDSIVARKNMEKPGEAEVRSVDPVPAKGRFNEENVDGDKDSGKKFDDVPL